MENGKLNPEERDRKDYFEVIFERAPDGILIVDNDGRILSANQEAERMFGYPKSDFLGKGMEMLVPERFRGCHAKHREDYNRDPRLRPMGMGLELFGRKSDGTEFPIEISLSPIKTSEETVTAAAIRDVSERKKAEAQIRKLNHQLEEALRRSERLAASGLLMASIAHEINNPLGSLANIFFLLKTQPHTMSVNEMVEIGEKDVERIADIVRQTLSPHREASTPAVIRPSEIIESVCESFGRQLDRFRINVDRNFEKESPVKVFPGELRQVITNLISNAIDAMPRGGSLTFAAKESDGYVRISISDTGHGIPDDKLQEVFEPFFTTKGEKGLGIGLWVSRNIIQKMGGSMNVKSSTGDKPGTEFVIVLPSVNNLQ